MELVLIYCSLKKAVLICTAFKEGYLLTSDLNVKFRARHEVVIFFNLLAAFMELVLKICAVNK